jgi:hypothetical protein
LSDKERRSHPRILKGVTVKFGIDDPIHNGISYDLSPKGMSIITDKVLPAKSNIIIEIDTENGGDVTVKGEVVWVSSIPDLPSRMGIRFKESNEELIRIYKTKKPRSK